jgi:hypothetical protein
MNLETLAIALKTMLLGGNLKSLTLLPHPRQLMLYLTESLLLFQALTGKRGIPQRNIYEVLPAGESEMICLGNLTRSGHWLGTASSFSSDLVGLCLICRLLKPKTIFEIGTLSGYTALQCARNAPEDARVYTLDLPQDPSVHPALRTAADDVKYIRAHPESKPYVFENTAVAAQITPLYGDSAVFDFGSHSYEYVRSDTLNALKCCHPGSVIAWHDFGRALVPGVSKWILELSKTRTIYCVPGGSLAFMVVEPPD